MSRIAARAGPWHEEPARHVQLPSKATEPRSRAKVARPADDLTACRELWAWIAAAEWLNLHGFAAAVPDHLIVPLRRRGFEVWATGSREAA
jgi:hypothetical protein